MTAPTEALCLDRTIQIDPDTADELIAACRRHDGPAALDLIGRWREQTGDEIWCDDDTDAEGGYYESLSDLTGWVRDEAQQHIAAGRHEHALCLIERYTFSPYYAGPFKQ